MKIEGDNPFRGPFPYKEADEDIFFGRKLEVEELIGLIRKNQLTVLYGASGTGKTSLIHAKLLPQLKREYFHPIYIRINFANDDEDPLSFIQKRIVEELRIWDKHIPEFGLEQSLIDYAAKNVIFKGLIKPVLFFDQFEELFTLGPKTDPYRINRFIFQLSELIELRLPDNLKTLDYINNISSFKVVFSLRQEWIGFLDDFNQLIPSIGEVRFRLKKFSPSQAFEAIMFPSKNTITPETAVTIIENIGTPAIWKEQAVEPAIHNKKLINREIDPFVLSLYCYQLYDKCVARGHLQITKEYVVQHRETELIRNYYEEKIAKYNEIKYLIEGKLLNESGKRLTVSLKRFVKDDKELEKVTHLVATETGIVRVIGAGKESEIEIVHDRLALQIFDSKNERITKEKHEEATKKERQAESLRQAAKRAKRTTFKISIISAAIIILLTAFAIKIYVNFKNDHTLIGLHNQLTEERRNNIKAFDSIKALNKLISVQDANSGLELIHSQKTDKNDQEFRAHDMLIRQQKSKIDSIKNLNTQLTASLNSKIERIQQLEMRQLANNETIRNLEAGTYSTPPEHTDAINKITSKFQPDNFSSLKILNARSGDGYDLTDIKRNGFKFSFKIAPVADQKGKIEIRVYTNVTRKDGTSENEFEFVKDLQGPGDPVIVVKAPKGLKAGKASYDVKYFIERGDTESTFFLDKNDFIINDP